MSDSKLCPVLLACLLWIQVANQQTVQRTISLTVGFVNIPQQLEISEYDPRQVDAVIRSSRGTAITDYGDLAVLVDLSNSATGIEVIPLTKDHVTNLPYGTEIVEMKPSRLSVVLETTARKIVKVEPVLSGSPASGYQVAGMEVVPKEVVIRGPESRLEKLSSASTQPIDITKFDASSTLSVYLDLDDPGLRVEGTNSVTVNVKIEKQRRQVKLRRVSIQVNPPDSGIRLITKTVDVEGSVPLSFAGQLRRQDFVAVVQVGGLQPDREPYELTPQIRPPEEWAELFRMESVTPSEVKILKTK